VDDLAGNGRWCFTSPTLSLSRSGTNDGGAVGPRHRALYGLDGLITHDKFCFVRSLVLPLSWWRRPLHMRTLSLQRRGVVHAGGTDETGLEHPSPLRGQAQQPDSLGSGVSAPPALDDQRSGRDSFPRSPKGGV